LVRLWCRVVSAVIVSPHFGCLAAAAESLETMNATTAKAAIAATEVSGPRTARGRDFVLILVLPCPAAQELGDL
jgi:hypothetical protein